MGINYWVLRAEAPEKPLPISGGLTGEHDTDDCLSSSSLATIT
jgi:hypothetical protein